MFNWDEFRNEKVAVWCDTEEKAREFIEECFARDLKLTFEAKILHYLRYENETCYSFKKSLKFSSKDFAENQDYKIIEWRA